VYEAWGHNSVPGPRDQVIKTIKEAMWNSGQYHEARAEVERLKAELVDANNRAADERRTSGRAKTIADGLAAELDAIRAPRCLTDEEAVA
ncbi:hypothetical protein, partial [Streptococcus pneumoniae]|uniref:hypothetical protein n=1 Tax=Streptococcus pneumoniae TaxID=1313 RepID=UPI0018B0C2DD